VGGRWAPDEESRFAGMCEEPVPGDGVLNWTKRNVWTIASEKVPNNADNAAFPGAGLTGDDVESAGAESNLSYIAIGVVEHEGIDLHHGRTPHCAKTVASSELTAANHRPRNCAA
jgi:hypothetical protein